MSSARSTWSLYKNNSSVAEYNKIAKLCFPKSGVPNDLFSFIIVSRYITSEVITEKGHTYREYSDNIRLYLQAKQVIGEHMTKDKRLTIKELEVIFDVSGFKEWFPPFSVGQQEPSPYLLAHVVASCSDAYLKGGILRLKGRGKRMAESNTVHNSAENKDRREIKFMDECYDYVPPTEPDHDMANEEVDETGKIYPYKNETVKRRKKEESNIVGTERKIGADVELEYATMKGLSVRELRKRIG